MTSLEIAALTGARHDSIKRSINRMSEKGFFTLPPTLEVSSETFGPKKITAFSLCEAESLLVVAQVKPEVMVRLVTRWKQLEEEKIAASHCAIPDFSDPAAMAEAWAAQYRASRVAQEKVAALESKAEADEPLIAFAQTVADSDDCVTMLEMSKILGTGSKRLFDALIYSGVLFRTATGIVPYQPHIDNGRFRVVETAYKTDGGHSRLSHKTVVTGKGQRFVAVQYQAFVESMVF